MRGEARNQTQTHPTMNEPSEMPTPRTDKNKFELAWADGPDTEHVEFVVDANICAQLERESERFRQAGIEENLLVMELRRDLSTLRKAAEAARVAIEAAPHPEYCVIHYASDVGEDECTCWKAAALAALRSELEKTTQ